MSLDQLKRQWQEKAILDLPAGMQLCAACLLTDSSRNTTLLLLRSQYEQTKKDFVQQTITLDQRDVQLAKVRLGFQQLVRDIQESDILREAMNEQSPDLPEQTPAALTPPNLSLPLAEYGPAIREATHQLRHREEELLHQFADAAIPTGEWLQQIGTKIQEQSLQKDQVDQFMKVLNVYLDKGTTKLQNLNQTLFQSYPGFDQLYHDYDALLANLIEYGESKADAGALEQLKVVVPDLLAAAAHAKGVQAELAQFKNMEMLASLCMFNKPFYQSLQRSLELLAKIHQTVVQFVDQSEKRTIELDLIFS